MTLCTGRLPKDERYCSSLPQLDAFANKLPDPLSFWSTTDLVQQQTGKDLRTLFPLNGNDRWGDCTCVAASHLITLHEAFGGRTVIPSEQDVVNLYLKLGNGRDNGLMLSTVLSAWRSGILGGYKIGASCNVNVNTANLKQIKQAVQYMGSVYIGFATTRDTVPQFQAGQPFTVTNSRTAGGHCVAVTGFNDQTRMVELLTWGKRHYGTYEWLLQYCDEGHALLTPQLSAFDNSTVEEIQKLMPSLA